MGNRRARERDGALYPRAPRRCTVALVNYLDALLTEARDAYTPAVLLAAGLALFLARGPHQHRPRFRSMLFFAGMHLLAVAACASSVVFESALANTLRIGSWLFGAIGFVSATASLLFTLLLPRLRLAVPLIVQDVFVGLAMIAASLSVLSQAGFDLSGLIATSAVVTVVLGFSLQDVIGNIASGLALQIDSSVEAGDWIKVGDVVGKVVEVRWRHTAVETRNWETVLIPNAVITKSNVVILGRRRGQPPYLRRWVHFHVDWRHQPGDVIDVVQTAVKQAHLDNVAREPAPNVVLMDLADTYGKYAVRYWLTDIAPDDPTDSAVRSCVYFALQRAGMSLAMPAHALFVTEETSDRKALKTEKQLRRCRELLTRVDLFAGLSDAEYHDLARHMRYAPFGPGEVMTRQGAEAHWLYLIEDGEASVTVSDGATEHEVARLRAPTFFGEMSLLTGEPRSATVIAISEVECFRLDKAALQRLLDGRPELAAHLARVLAERHAALLEVKEGLDAQTAKRQAERQAVDLLAHIRSFFALDRR